MRMTIYIMLIPKGFALSEAILYGIGFAVNALIFSFPLFSPLLVKKIKSYEP